MSRAQSWTISIPSRGNSNCKGAKAGARQANSRKSEDSGCGGVGGGMGWVGGGEVMGDGYLEVMGQGGVGEGKKVWRSDSGTD